MLRRIFFIILLLMLSADLSLAGGFPAGSVKTVQGETFVERDGVSLPLEKGMKIFSEDLLVTGNDASLGIILRDNTIFSMGPDSSLSLDEFVFAPVESEFSLLVRMIKGTFVYISGVIAKLSPESIHMETPVGVVAVRGTRFAAKISGNQ